MKKDFKLNKPYRKALRQEIKRLASFKEDYLRAIEYLSFIKNIGSRDKATQLLDELRNKHKDIEKRNITSLSSDEIDDYRKILQLQATLKMTPQIITDYIQRYEDQKEKISSIRLSIKASQKIEDNWKKVRENSILDGHKKSKISSYIRYVQGGSPGLGK